MRWVVAFALSVIPTAAHSTPMICYSAWGYGTDTLTPVPLALVRAADVVLVADAEDSLPSINGATDLLRGRRVQFVVQTVLRGRDMPSHFSLPGILVKDDDFNSGRRPYENARPAAMGGSCFAFTYRRGARYVFLLKRITTASIVFEAGALTPYWAPLRPTNEQIRGDGDRWLAWVRSHLN